MRLSIRSVAMSVAALTLLGPSTNGPSAQRAGVPAGGNWPSFRGPGASGVAEDGPAPTRWNVPGNSGVRWKTPIPGLGHSSPVIWSDRVCVTTAESAGARSSLRVGLYGDITPVDDDSRHAWKVVCLDKRDGSKLWERVVHEGVPAIKRHPKSTHASATLATDGERIVAMFGSEGLYALGMDGRMLWKQDLGVLDSGFFMAPTAQWGWASSPIIHEGKVIVQADVQQDSFLAAFDVADGEEIWRTPRQDVPTWSTPNVYTLDGRSVIVVNGLKQIGGYDADTGRAVWTLSGGGDIPVPTPVIAHGLVFITNSHGGASPVYAVRLDAKGDVTSSGGPGEEGYLAWSETRDGAYMQTPLVYGDHLYVCRDNGVLTVFEATTGTRLYQQRLGRGRTGFSASAVAADGKVYFTSEEGDVYVVKAGPEFEQLAVNPLGEVAMATPALSEGVLYFRTRDHVVAIDGDAR